MRFFKIHMSSFILILISSISLFSQEVETIQLFSNSIQSAERNQIVDTIKVSITAEHEVFIQEERELYWDNLVPRIMNIDRSSDMIQMYLSKIIIEGEPTTKYRFIDKLKQEIGRTFKKYFLYRSFDRKNEVFLVEKNHGSTLGRWPLKLIRTKKHEFDSILSIKSIQPEWMNKVEKFPNDELKQDFNRYLYSGDSLNVNRILEKFGFVDITLLPNKQYKIGAEIKDNNDMDLLNSYILQGNVVFVRFDYDLEYQDYISYLAAKKANINISAGNFGTEGVFVEVSLDLEKKLKKWKLDIFE